MADPTTDLAAWAAAVGFATRHVPGLGLLLQRGVSRYVVRPVEDGTTSLWLLPACATVADVDVAGGRFREVTEGMRPPCGPWQPLTQAAFTEFLEWSELPETAHLRDFAPACR